MSCQRTFFSSKKHSYKSKDSDSASRRLCSFRGDHLLGALFTRLRWLSVQSVEWESLHIYYPLRSSNTPSIHLSQHDISISYAHTTQNLPGSPRTTRVIQHGCRYVNTSLSRRSLPAMLCYHMYTTLTRTTRRYVYLRLPALSCPALP
jgi:hypothetical protein